MKTILHISRMNFLSDKAHVYTTTKTCEALAMPEGVRVILLSTDNSLADAAAKKDFFKKHGVRREFEIVSLPSFANAVKGSGARLINWLETVMVNISVLRYIVSHRREFDILYFRDTSLPAPILTAKYILRKPIFMELHAVLHKRYKQALNDFFAKISNGLVAISFGLKEYYEKINPKIMVAFCAAAEPERFAMIKESKERLREELRLPRDKTILMYSGNLYKTGNYDSYGIEDIIKAMPLLDAKFIFVGVGKKGNETKEHEALARELGVAERVVFLPWMAKQEVYRHWRAADILLMPASGAQIGNSPTKMFEYLASGRPIVSADTAAIAEVLRDGENALLVDYKDPSSWAEAIKKISHDAELSKRLVSGALLDSREYSWLERGRRIWLFISSSVVK